MPRITLVGYRGSGKSSVAARLAMLLGCSWQDADDVLEREAGDSIAALIASRGEDWFRDLESTVLDRLLAAEAGVLATGGGVILREANRAALWARGRPVVWLTAPAEVLRARLAADPTTAVRRPALSGTNPLDEVAATLVARDPFYREVADAVIDVSSEPPARIAARIAAWLGRSARTDLDPNHPAAEPIP
ncbi:MAG: shikimate kinase [Planctomycetota bacterium]